jgi:membrane protease YdiL (CAAX protease family)
MTAQEITSWPASVVHAVRSALVDRVPRDHQQPDQDFTRRRVVVAGLLVVGAVLLGVSLSVRPGDAVFYPLTLAVAATWAVGGVLSGPLHLGYVERAGRTGRTQVRPVLSSFVVGLVSAGVFILGALVVREIPPLHDYVEDLLAHARKGSLGLITLVTVVNGVAEEVFFRGGLFAAIGRRHPVLLSTAIYALATAATRNPMLVFAALTLGLVLGLERRASGGILAPVITHVTWSLLMLFLLPPLFAGA